VPGRSWEFATDPDGSKSWRRSLIDPHIGSWGAGLLVSLADDRTGVFRSFAAGRCIMRRRCNIAARWKKLNEIATQVSARLDSPQDVLDHMASAARELLDMDRSIISLVQTPGGAR